MNLTVEKVVVTCPSHLDTKRFFILLTRALHT